MKNRNKIILTSFLALTPIAIATPLILTSCSNKKEDPLAKTYQYDYSKEFSLFLDKDKKPIVKKADNGYSSLQYLAFKYSNVSLNFTDAWILLMRDIKTNEIFASFCGWDRALVSEYNFNKRPDFINEGYTIPLYVTLPDNYTVEGLEPNAKIPVKSIGFSYDMMFELLSGDLKQISGIFPDNGTSSGGTFYPPVVGYTKKLDLLNSNIQYIFDNLYYGSIICYYSSDLRIETKVIFPENLVCLESQAVFIMSNYDNTILDFSQTKLVELKCLVSNSNGNVKIILPDSCVRISNVDCDDSKNLEINLKNILYFENYFTENAWSKYALNFKKINNNSNEIIINKDAKFLKDSFPEGFKVIDELGNELTPVD